MPDKIDQIVIHNEQEAFDALELALANDIKETASIKFEGWPTFKLTIQGEDFHGTIPTRIMPPILELQKEIYRIYCREKYQTENTRNLTKEERDQLELVVEVKEGSTEFIAALTNSLNGIIVGTGMTGPQAIVLIVSIGILITAGYMWKQWLKNKEVTHQQDISVELSQEESKRLEIVTEALTQQPKLQEISESIEELKTEFARKLKPTDSIKIDNQELLSGGQAALLTAKARRQKELITIDGEFEINEIKFPKVFGESYRFSVTRVIDGQKLFVDATPDVLSREQIGILKEGAFGVKTVLMEISAQKTETTITNANLIAITWPQKS